MAQPTNNINGIVIDNPLNVATPPPGSVNYFFNSADNNKMYYKDSNNVWFQVSSGTCDPCLCEQAAKTLCAWNQALTDKTITITDYQALLASGAAFTCTNGTDTWTVTIHNDQ